MKGIRVLAIAFVICMTVFAGSAHSQEGEEELFSTTGVLPDALILLDLSGSMNWTPAGGTMYTSDLTACMGLLGITPFYSTSGAGHEHACTINPYGTVPKWGDATCNGPFYTTSLLGTRTDCSRLAIAKRAIFDLLDDNENGTITSSGTACSDTSTNDECSLRVRVGYMRWYDCEDSTIDRDPYRFGYVDNYTTGCNTRIRNLGAVYSRIICNNSSTCSSAITTCSSCVAGESADGGTPIAAGLSEARAYLNDNKAADSAAACRSKFVILVADGADTYACGGNGSDNTYEQRKATVAKAKALADAGYKVFVVGFGSNMPVDLQRTLNWAAYHGGTDNPLVANTGDPDDIIPSDAPCTEGDTNDPADAALSGYAFFAASADDLAAALKTAISLIREATYSFAVPAVASIREVDENNLYQASFDPQNNDPFWPGHMIKYNINTDGSLGSEEWNAADVLAATAAADRNIYTYKAGQLKQFTVSDTSTCTGSNNITCADLGGVTLARRNQVVNYIRGVACPNDSGCNPDTELGNVLKLGDIFRSNPEIVGTPLTSFNDFLDTNNAFAQFRTDHPRTSAADTRIIVAGANDGQFHAFKTGTGAEAWSFIPPNLLPKLQLLAHTAHPTTLTHQYFVDGPITRSDVWLGTGDGTAKSASDWKTYLVFGEGRGVEPLSSYLWSASQYCDSGFRSTYHATLAPYYCGYHALDVTDATSAPVYKWHLNFTSTPTLAPYMGDPWGKVSIARVKIGDGTNINEKWVGFVGAGYNAEDCATGGSCDTRGKGFLVIDMADGSVLKSWTRADSDTADMDYSLVATPASLDTDNDGFVDTVFIGDLGGSVWRFTLCTRTDDETCTIAAGWGGGLFFQASSGVIRPIYTKPVAARDTSGNLWVYWGTGDKTDPTGSAQEKFFALRDDGGTYTIADLENITSINQAADATKQGWYINLSGGGEKILGEPAVFGGVVYFTSYTPQASGGDPCGQAGTPKLYGVDYTTGAGALYNDTQRSVTLAGVGIPSAPIISLAPGGSPIDVIINVSGGAGQGGTIITNPPGVDPQGLANLRNIRFWRDRRLVP